MENLSKTLYRINLIVSYPLSDLQLLEWSECILKLKPETTNENIENVIDAFILGKIEYKPNLGLRNIFVGLEKINEKPCPYTPAELTRFRKLRDSDLGLPSAFDRKWLYLLNDY